MPCSFTVIGDKLVGQNVVWGEKQDGHIHAVHKKTQIPLQALTIHN